MAHQYQQHTTHNEQTHNEHHRTRKVASSVLLTKMCPYVGLSLDPEAHQRNLWILHIFSSRIDREQHVPDSSNHSLYLIKLFIFCNLEGSPGGNQQPDGSTSLSPSPPSLRPPPQQHTTSNTQRQRHTDTDKTQVYRTICTSDTFRDVRLKESFTFHNGFMFFFKHLLQKYFHVIMNRQGRHNIRNEIVWVQTGHNTCTCTFSLHVVEL